MRYVGPGSLMVYKLTFHVIGSVVETPPLHEYYLHGIGRHSWIVERMCWQEQYIAILWKAEVLSETQFNDWPNKKPLPEGGWTV